MNQTSKLVWLIDTIHTVHKITFDDINKKWQWNELLSGGEELSKRTFHKWKIAIEETFGLYIECEKFAPYRYYIENEDEIENNSIIKWMMETFTTSTSLLECASIKERILLEDVPSGRIYLNSILQAMKENRYLHITYYNYWREDEREHYLMPLCVKLFRQRWYLVGRTWPVQNDALFCLDRIRDLRLSSHQFEYPHNFSPQRYFEGCFGIIADKSIKIQDVLLKVTSGQANYLRDLPMLPGDDQQEIERQDEYSIFKLRVRPSFDFQQEILWNGSNIEVLEPQWLRKEIAGMVKRMHQQYENGNRTRGSNKANRESQS